MLTAFDTSNLVGDAQPCLSRAIVDYLFDFKGPKFLFDDIYHFSIRHYQKHAHNRNMLPVVKLMLSTVLNHTADQNLPLFFVPEAITNGRLYYDLAEKHEKRIREVRGELNTFRMGEILKGGELQALTEKNKNRAMTRLEGFQKIFPDTLAISPTGMAAMLKCLLHEPGFRNFQKLADQDFEAFWIGVCLASQKGGFSDEVAYSRNGNFETFALFQIQYGLIPFRPHADCEVVFPTKKTVTPYDYLQMLFSHMLDVVPRGFSTDLSVKMAVRMMMLESMRTKKMEHPQWGGLDIKKISPDLKGLSYTHTKDFDMLKRDVLRFMMEHNLGQDLADKNYLSGYDGLETFYHEQIADIGPVFRGAGVRPYDIYKARNAHNLDMDHALEAQNLSDSHVFRAPYQLDGEFFSKPSKVFNEDHFSQCSKLEQIALRTFMGLIETPKAAPAEMVRDQGDVLLLIDRRGGEAAAEFSGEYGLVLPSESRGLKSSFQERNFEEAVKVENVTKSLVHADRLSAIYPTSRITTLEHIEGDFENLRLYREAFVAPGPERLSPTAKLAYGEEMLRRNARMAVFDPGWENSTILTGLRMHARKVQLGLVERPVHMPKHSMIIGDMADNGTGYVPQSLAQDLKSLSDYMEALVDVETENMPRALVKALVETGCLMRCYYSEEANSRLGGEGHGLIDWQSVPMAAKKALDSDKEAVTGLLAKAKEMVLAHGLDALSLDDVSGDVERIDPDYKLARENLDADQRILKSRKARPSSYQKLKGFNAA